MKGLEVEMERLRQLVVALVGKEEVGCASGSSGGKVMREMLGKAYLSLRGGKVKGRKEIGHKETGQKEMGTKETGGKET